MKANKVVNNSNKTILSIPLETINKWIDSIDTAEFSVNQRIYAKDDMIDFINKNKEAETSTDFLTELAELMLKYKANINFDFTPDYGSELTFDVNGTYVGKTFACTRGTTSIDASDIIKNKK